MAENTKDLDKKQEQAVIRHGGSMVSFDDLERWFEDVFPQRWLPSFFERGWPSLPAVKPPFEGRTPKVDVIDREAEILVRAELPGVDKDHLEVSMTDDMVTIKASTRYEKEEEKGEYYRHEMSAGEFQRSLSLPAPVKSDAAKASFKDGVLELTIPKAEVAKRRSIKVD
jgi:HSP20 family protein